MKLARFATIILIVAFLQADILFADYRIFDKDIQIIASDETGVTFKYFAPSVELITPAGYPEKYKYPSMARTMQIRQPDTPLLPVKVVPIGIPPGSNPTLSVLNWNYSPVAETEVPNFVSGFSEESFNAGVISQKAYKDYPSPIAYIKNESIIRGLKVIKIFLAAAKIENGMLHKAEEITVRVDFNNPGTIDRTFPRSLGPVFERILPHIVANYDIARNWRADLSLAPFKTQAAQSVFDSAEVWVRIEISNTAVYRINRFDLGTVGIDVSEVDPRNFRMFYGGGKELPVDNDLPRPELFEIPVRVTGSGDGSFDLGDLLLFYGEAADRFEYDSGDQEFVFRYNHYTPKNVYWFTPGGSFAAPPKRWTEVDGSPSGTPAVRVDKFTDVTHLERETALRFGNDHEYVNYYEWFWGNDTSFTSSFQLSNVVSGSEALVKVRTGTSFNLSLYFNNQPATKISQSGNFALFSTSNVISGTSFNSLYLRDISKFYLDYFDIFYNRWLAVANNVLNFNSPEIAGVVEYQISEVPAEHYLLDITSNDSLLLITDAQVNGGTLTFQQVNEAKHIYYLTATQAVKAVSSLSLYESDDLRSTANQADFIIITPELFYDQSLELAEHRERQSPNITVRVVKLEDVLNQFSRGLYDPLAIRDFLKYAFENWSGAPASYALLVGDGHYDFRNNLGSGSPIYMPPYEGLTPSGGASWASDEAYVYFGDYGYLDSDDAGYALDMIIGRLSVNNTNQMDVIVNKIISYESDAQMGRWRNNVIVVADDHLTNESSTQDEHTLQAEALANYHVPPGMEVQKIYLVEFPVRAGNSKPDARETLIDAFNNGGLIVNWIGHGSKSLWAHESIFRRVEDMVRLNNPDKLCLVLAASCSIGLFDHPTEQGLAEDFVRYPYGGAIASIGATRMVYASPNAQLNQEIFDQLLYSDSVTIGAALYIAKFLRQASGPQPNDQKFMMFGDPGVMIAKPILEVVFTHSPDSLIGLSVDSVAGEIHNDAGQLRDDFNGTVWVQVKDAQLHRHRALTDYNNNLIIINGQYFYLDYILPGPTIFNGPAEVKNGRFSTSFFIPKDISYGGSDAKIYVYFENGSLDGSGVTDSMPIAGGIAAEPDSAGPTIDVIYKNQSLTNGITAVPANAVFEARIIDEHGVNITGSMGHGIVVEIDNGDVYAADITSGFVFDMGDWQQGSVTFEIGNIPSGEHQLTLKAWDNYNNSTLFTAAIQAYEDDHFFIDEVMNYPNPVVKADSTEFQYMLSHDAEKVSLKIFTLAGRKIKSVDLYGSQYTASGYRRYLYDLRDDDNDRLASGVYIYLIEATGTGLDQKRTRAEFQSKLVILR